MTISRSCLFAVVFFAGPALAAPQIGDKAPVVKVQKWMTTTPEALPGAKDSDKHCYIVEFWATWCGPCRQSIPHLAELHRKLAKDGLVVIGVSNEDPDTISKFMNRKTGGKTIDMPYHVGSDDDNATNEAWMEGIEGIPHAFLVDKTNTVVWTGHPLSPDMEAALSKLVAGKFDLATAKAEAAKAKKYDELMKQAQQAAESKDSGTLFKIIDELIATKPTEVMPYLMKRHFLGQFERPGEIPALDAKLADAMKDNKDGLKQITEFQLDRPITERNAAMMYRSIVRASELTQAKDAQIQAILARVQWEFGMLEEAVATMEQSVKVAGAENSEEFKKALAYYKEVIELRKKLRP